MQDFEGGVAAAVAVEGGESAGLGPDCEEVDV